MIEGRTFSMNAYIVKPGDTLGKIAKKRLGAAGRWREIAEINHIVQPHLIRVGMSLKMPRTEPALLEPVRAEPLRAESPSTAAASTVRFSEEGKHVFYVDSQPPEKRSLGRLFRKGLYRTGELEPETYLNNLSVSVMRQIGLTKSERNVLLATAENEGNLDAINTWDANFLSFGMFQWTAGQANAKGELASLLHRLQTTQPSTFAHYFGEYGLSASVGGNPAYGDLSIKGKTLKSSDDKAKLRDYGWIYRFVRSSRDPSVQQTQIVHAIDRLDQFYYQPKNALLGLSLSEVVTSEYGVALLLDNHVNRPAHPVKSLAKAISALGYSKEKIVNGDDQTESALVRRYLAIRHDTSMTDSKSRAQVTKGYVDGGDISAARGSFKSGRNNR
jgi:hypothetical protein